MPFLTLKIVFGVVLGLGLTALGFIMGGLLANQVPWLEPPGFSARLKLYLTTHQAHAHPFAERPELITPIYPVPVVELQNAILQAITRLNWEIVTQSPGFIHAVVTTPLWHFQDDVQLALTPVPGGTQLDIKAQSRVGRGDLGANTRHIRVLLQTLLRHGF